jgi:hypothetical protein
MAQSTEAPTLLPKIDRSEEDRLDWLENHQAAVLPHRRLRHRFLGLSVALMAAAMAAMALLKS